MTVEKETKAFGCSIKKKMKKLTLMILVLTALASPAKPVYEELPADKIAALKKKPCTLIHVWATWCTVCLTELPDLLKVIASVKELNPVIVDVSSEFVQEHLLPQVDRHAQAAVQDLRETQRQGRGLPQRHRQGLVRGSPLSALYHKGVRKKGLERINQPRDISARGCGSLPVTVKY